MTALTPLGLPYPEVTDRVADGFDAIHDLAVATDALLTLRATTAALAAEAAARAAADTALGNRATALETANADSGWIALEDGVSLAQGWYAYGSGFVAPAYRKRRGVVHLRGMVKATSLPEAFPWIFTLPAGYRPGGIHIFVGAGQLNPAQYGNSGPTVTDVGIRIQIGSDGKVTPAQGVFSNAGVVSWVSLSGISFPADA